MTMMAGYLAILVVAVAPALSAPPIPSKLSDVGWQLGTSGAPKLIEVYGDFQCPDTKAAWDGWLRTFRARHSNAASIIFHPYPLPYHKNGFDAAQAAIVMAEAAPFAKVADALFAGQSAFQTDATLNTTQAELFSEILAPIATSVGADAAFFRAHMSNDDASNSAARAAWKAGAARGVSGTPTFAANGVVSDELAGWSLEHWEAWLAAE